jgi:hypothetical protein
VQAACAEKQGVEVLVSRNEADFAGLGLEVLSPVDLLSRLDGRTAIVTGGPGGIGRSTAPPCRGSPASEP